MNTFLTEKEYASRGGIRCPSCGSFDLTADAVNVDVGYAWQPVTCDDCHANWNDTYVLTGYDDLTNSSIEGWIIGADPDLRIDDFNDCQTDGEERIVFYRTYQEALIDELETIQAKLEQQLHDIRAGHVTPCSADTEFRTCICEATYKDGRVIYHDKDIGAGVINQEASTNV